MDTTSRTLLERVRDPGDREAWGRFFGLYAPLLESYARSHGLAPTDAAEVRDQCLAVVAAKIPEFAYDPAAGTFKAWLHRMARGKVVDFLRRRRSSPALESACGEVRDPGSTPEEMWEAAWRAEHLRHALDDARRRVGERAFAAFEAFALDGQSAQAVADTLGLSANQVYKAKARTLEVVRECLRRSGLDAQDLLGAG